MSTNVTVFLLKLYCKNAQNSRAIEKILNNIDEHNLIIYNTSNKSDYEAHNLLVKSVQKKEVRKSMSGISKILLIIFALFVLQALGGVWQIQNYRKAIRRVHQYGNVGFGQKRGGFTAGYIVMIACDQSGIITGGEIMQGISFFAKFKPLKTLLGKEVLGTSIYEFLDDMKDFDKKQKKKYKGYLNALEALAQRFESSDEEESLEAL